MFKSKKTQFAIRKMAKGTAAVLLSFGMIGSNLGGIVSAATSEESIYQTDIKTDYEQADIKIAYFDQENNYVGSAPVIEIKKGEIKTKAELSDAIYNSLPNGYELVDPTLADISDYQATGQTNSHDIKVTVKKRHADIKIAFVDENGKYINSLTPIDLNFGETVSREELIAAIKNGLTPGYELSDPNLSYVTDWTFDNLEHSSHDITVKVRPTKETTTEYKSVKRTITIIDINGNTKTIDQSVVFSRQKTILGGNNSSASFTDWQAKDGKDTWGEVKIDSVANYRTLIDNQEGNLIAEKKVSAKDPDVNITVTYEPVKSIITPDDVKDPLNEDLKRIVTRKIITHAPDGSENVEYQKVTFVRNKEIFGNKTIYTEWKLEKDSPSNWPAYTIKPIKNYDSYIDGKKGHKITAETVNPETADKAIHISFVKQTSKKGDIKIAFIDENGKQIGGWDSIPFELENGKKREDIIAFIKDKLPKGYELEDSLLSNIEDIEAGKDKDFYDFKVKIKAIKKTSTERRTLKRIINITDPNGKTKTNTQEVNFSREIINFENGDSPIYSKWIAEDGNDIWSQVDLPQFNNFESLIDGKPGKTVLSQKVNPEDKEQVINVSYKPIKQVITPDDVKDPVAEDLLKRVTRKIVLNLPDGKQKVKNDTVTYQRNKVILGDKETYTHWELAKGSQKQWQKYNIPVIEGYDSYVDGKITTTINAEDANWDKGDKTIYVDYIKQDAQVAEIKIAYVDENGKKIKSLDKINFEVGQTYEAEKLKEIINSNLPENYVLVDQNLKDIEDLTATTPNESFSLEIPIKGKTVTPNKEYSDAQADLFKRMYRKISITRPDKPNSTETKIQTITFSRSKVYKGSSSAKSRAANENGNWEYTDWQIHDGSSKTWASHSLIKFDGYQAVINYPKFMDDPEDRNIEDHTVEERSVVIDPRDENADDVTRNVTVTYRPLAQNPETPESPDNPDEPTNPDTPDNPDIPNDPANPDTPDNPDIPNDPTNPDTPDNPTQPEQPEQPGDSDSSDTEVNQPEENIPGSDSDSSQTPPITGQLPNLPVIGTDSSTITTRPLASDETVDSENQNLILPEAGADTSMKASTAGIISVAIASLIGGIGALIGRKNRKKDE